MISRRTKTRAAVGWLVVLLQFSVSVETPLGLDLCVADDGHTTLEFSHSELPCAQDSLRHASDHKLVAAFELPGYPCSDLPLLGASVYARASKDDCSLPVPYALAVPGQPAPPFTSRSLRVGAVAVSSSQQQATHLLRTVILLV